METGFCIPIGIDRNFFGKNVLTSGNGFVTIGADWRWTDAKGIPFLERASI
jgi:hypothetical protein